MRRRGQDLSALWRKSLREQPTDLGEMVLTLVGDAKRERDACTPIDTLMPIRDAMKPAYYPCTEQIVATESRRGLLVVLYRTRATALRVGRGSDGDGPILVRLA